MPPAVQTPLISIIVPVYNAKKYLAQTLQSVQGQTLPLWELIAVDDGSNDSSADIVREYIETDPRIRLVQQANAGVASARNRGFAEAASSSQYVIFLDQDDLWYENTLETLHRALETHTHCCAAFGQTQFIDAQSAIYTEQNCPQSVKDLEKLVTRRTSVEGESYADLPAQMEVSFETFIVANCIVSPGGVLIRRSALPEGTLFDNQAAPCDDWDLYIRLTRYSPLHYVSAPIFRYRIHNTNASRNSELMLNVAYGVRRKALYSAENTSSQHRMAWMVLLYCEQRSIKDRSCWMREALSKGRYVEAAKHLRHYCIARINIYQMSVKAKRLKHRTMDVINGSDTFRRGV